MAYSKAELEQRKKLKTTFIVFLVIALVCVALTAGLVVISFFMRTDRWPFWVVLAVAIGLFVATVFAQKKSISAKRDMDALDKEHRKKKN